MKNYDNKSSLRRRSFLKTAGLGTLFLGMGMNGRIAEELEFLTSGVNRYSAPSDLKITDMRVVVLNRPRTPIIRIDTNQGVYGLGEVRDIATHVYALMLKSRILGKNPCNVEQIFKEIKQFGYHGRQGGGVSAVEMALWDLTGKVFNVPVYQLLGGKYRDHIRLYADTTQSTVPEVYARRMKERKEKHGFTFLKMDFGIGLMRNVPGTIINREWFEDSDRHDLKQKYHQTEHPFTGIQLTNQGIDQLAGYVDAVRNAVGYEIPMAADHFGHIGVNTCIRLGQALEPYRLAWLEDMIPWFYTDQWREITLAINTPTLTGEDIYLKEEFIKLIDTRAVDMVHPDLATAGGILETKKIGDYAQENGVPMAMHFAGSPVSFMANIHCAAATENFIALEHHFVDMEHWEDLVTGIEKPLADRGYAKVPDKPGLGIELNEEVVREHMNQEIGYFKPTPEWDEVRSWDRLWS